MSHPYKEFEPKWFDDDYSDKSYRSIFKWGEKRQIKAPRESLYKMIKDVVCQFEDVFDHLVKTTGLNFRQASSLF